ncbi:MAG TPA: hypothetical protein VFN44_14245 [Solirubrobacteraceae bacterium]|nr:hypothetical protein [Solirubrobacteraceae bacterium]
MTEREWDGSTAGHTPGREREPAPAAPAPVTAPALMRALQRSAGNAAVARWLRAESEKGQGPDAKPVGAAEGAESVLVTATITEGGVTQEVTPGGSTSASPAPAKVEVAATGSTTYDGNAAGSDCSPDTPAMKDLDWSVKDAGANWGVQVTALRTTGKINVKPTPNKPTEMVTPNTANPVDGGNIENKAGSNNHWAFATKEMKEYHAPSGGKSAYWHSTAASDAHEYAHWDTDWMKTSVGGNWPQANKDIDAMTIPKADAADATAAKPKLKPKVEARFNTFSDKAIKDWIAIPDTPGVAGSTGYIAGQKVLDGLIAKVDEYAKTKKW